MRKICRRKKLPWLLQPFFAILTTCRVLTIASAVPLAAGFPAVAGVQAVTGLPALLGLPAVLAFLHLRTSTLLLLVSLLLQAFLMSWHSTCWYCCWFLTVTGISLLLQAFLLLFTSLTPHLSTLSNGFLHGVSAVACVPDFVDVTAVAGFSTVADFPTVSSVPAAVSVNDFPVCLATTVGPAVVSLGSQHSILFQVFLPLLASLL